MFPLPRAELNGLGEVRTLLTKLPEGSGVTEELRLGVDVRVAVRVGVLVGCPGTNVDVEVGVFVGVDVEAGGAVVAVRVAVLVGVGVAGTGVIVDVAVGTEPDDPAYSAL